MADTYTKFPEGIDTFEDNADLDSGHAAAAAQYTKYLADGKYTEASNYLNQNSGLRKYIIKAADINHVKHAITAQRRDPYPDMQERQQLQQRSQRQSIFYHGVQ